VLAGNGRDQEPDDAKARNRRDGRHAAPEAIRHHANASAPIERPSRVLMNTRRS
jgi:hypothetical protein